MTTIACDGRAMAADGLATEGPIATDFDYVKVWQLKDGSILGASGEASCGPALRDYLNGATEEVEAMSEWRALRLMPDGSGLYYCEKHPTKPIQASWPASVGSGEQLALGAMLAGADAREAIEIAIERDLYTGGKITVLSLKP